MNFKVCHLTSVHPRYDTRVFVKECRGLVRNGYNVSLLVADGRGYEENDGVKIFDIGKPANRLSRVFFYSKKILKKAIELDADVYHFHDPELLQICSELVKHKKKVIYDSHEDFPNQLMNKPYIPFFLRNIISKVLERYERKVVSKIAGIITVTPEIKNRFLESNDNVIEVRNFPVIKEFEMGKLDWTKKEDVVCYVGAISEIRGIANMVDAMQYTTDIKLLLGGNFESSNLRDGVIKSEGWRNVKELGYLSRDNVNKILQSAVAGLVVLKPTVSYLKSIPVKMFEYMAAGIPVIASDFEYWHDLIDETNCALFVDPNRPEEIGKAIQMLVNDKKLAKEMGMRGKAAIIDKFNWSLEEKKLLKFYTKLLNSKFIEK